MSGHHHQHGSNHSHSHEHGHSHEPFASAGEFAAREMLVADRDFSQRSFTVGIGGPVGSGKTHLADWSKRLFPTAIHRLIAWQYRRSGPTL